MTKNHMEEDFEMEKSTNDTKLCKHCQTEIPKKAKVCPNCRKKQGGIGKWIVLAVVAVIIIAAVAGGGSDGGDTAADPSPKQEQVAQKEEKQEQIEYVEVTATDLINAYNENQVKCKKDYDGQYLKVTGTVSSVGTDVMDSVYVCLGHDTEYTFVGIQCYAKDKDTEDKIAELKEGDEISVTGIGECGSLSFSLKKAEVVE